LVEKLQQFRRLNYEMWVPSYMHALSFFRRPLFSKSILIFKAKQLVEQAKLIEDRYLVTHVVRALQWLSDPNKNIS
jgi:hypothetical protein